MIKYSKDEFFSFRHINDRPEFLIEIEYVTYNTDDSVINDVIEKNKVIIQNNIRLKQDSKKTNRGGDNSHKKNICVRPRKFIKSDKNITNISIVLNKLTNDKLMDLIPTIIGNVEECEDYNALCECFYNRIMYEYTYIKMYAIVVTEFKKRAENGDIFILNLNKFMKEKFDKFNDMFCNISDNETENEIYSLERKKFMGVILFISHLYNFKMGSIDEYIEALKDNKGSTYIEMLCKMLYISGKNLEQREEILTHLVNLQNTTSSRIYFEVQNVIDYKKQNWTGAMACTSKITDTQLKQVKRSKEVDIGELINKYKDGKLEIKEYSKNVLQEFMIRLLDQVLDKKEVDIVNLAIFCKKNIQTSITEIAIINIKENLEELRIDIPNVDLKLEVFEMNLLVK